MKKNIALAIAVALLIDAYAANRRAVKSINKMGDVATYFAHKLDETGYEVTEFDTIAVMSLID